ncbi:heparinase II/III family protein [Jeotgalicoccus sp. WY2]|uniref:heparinase II/III family protein n=1 Tax=Jeotgalicoccus sp. WY2 TaxID=2708346 RepID=UPI001BD35D13|nr:heparinase II/III family protein [Jeotgalicoccus sp. WY2]
MKTMDKNLLIELNNYNVGKIKVSHTKNSDLALQNKYIFFPGFDIVEFPEGINWNYKHNHAAGTYQIYLHCLTIVRNLVNSYLMTKMDVYIKKAREIIIQWMTSSSNETYYSKNSSWRDHSSARRMKTIIYFQQNSPEDYKIDENLFEELLVKHCDFLSRKEFYAENNHGMMSDEGLLFLSCYLTNESLSNLYRQTSVLRMERMILKLFSSKGYNLENSPEYHRVTQNIASDFIKLTKY